MAITKQYTKKDGTKAWMFQAYLGVDPLTGKEKRTTRRGFKTEKEANLALARLQLDIDKKGFHTEYNIKTFQDLYEAWIEQYQHAIKPTTYKRIIGAFSNVVLPGMGHMQLKNITPATCQKIMNKWAEKYKYKTLLMIRTYVKMVFEYGIRMDICDSNPFDKITIPKKGLEESAPNASDAFYTKDELKCFFDCLKQMGSLLRLAFFRVLAFTGARKGEILALTWNDINFKNGTLTINKTLVKVDGKFAIQTPKTKTSNRTISLDPETLATLRKWQLEQKRVKLALGLQKGAGEDIIFSSTDSTYLYLDYPNHCLRMIYKQFPELKKIKIHGFRHTHASLLFESGADIKVVQQRLGHSNIKTTMDIYTHVSQEHEKDSGLRFAKYVNF